MRPGDFIDAETLVYAAVFTGVVIAVMGMVRLLDGGDAAARARSRRLQRIRAAGSADCTSSDNLGHLNGFRVGGSGPSLIEITRFQFHGASAA